MARRYINGNTITIPSTLNELEEMLDDSATMTKVFANKNTFGEFIVAYAQASMADGSLGAQIKEQTQQAIFSMLRNDSGKGVKRLDLNPGAMGARSALYNRKAPGSKVDPVMAGSSDVWGDFFGNVWHGNRSAEAGEFQAKVLQIQNAFGSNVPSDGGFLIPEVLRSEILSLSLEEAIVRPRARVLPMGSLRLPIPTVDDNSHASTVFGGLSAAWTEEGAQLTASSAKFARVVLEAKKLTVYADIPNELVADSGGALGAFLAMALPGTIAFAEDSAFLLGTGVGEPLGALKGAALIVVAKESGQVADTIVWQNIVKLYARMLPSSLTRAVWVVSPDTFPELATMALSVGTGGSAVWVANDGISGPPATLLGRPVMVSEKAAALGDQGDVSFIDFGHYLIGDRQSVSVQSSEHAKFENDMTSFRCIERVDGRPWLQTALTPKNGGPTLSPYVTLAAR